MINENEQIIWPTIIFSSILNFKIEQWIILVI